MSSSGISQYSGQTSLETIVTHRLSQRVEPGNPSGTSVTEISPNPELRYPEHYERMRSELLANAEFLHSKQLYPISRESETESQHIDTIVKFLYRINYQEWLLEDSEVIENIESKYSLFLLDNTNCLHLMKCAYFENYATALYLEWKKREIGQKESEIPYFNFCRRPEWLAASAALVLKKWSQFQGSPKFREWHRRLSEILEYGVLEEAIPLCTVFDILVALGHFIDQNLFEQPNSVQTKYDLSQFIHKFCNNDFTLKNPITEYFGVKNPIWKDEIRCPTLRNTWYTFHQLWQILDDGTIPLIQSLAGIHFYTRSRQLPDLPFPKKVPDHTALGLLKDVGRAKSVSDIHITELAADRIVRTRPYKFAITRSIEHHLLVDGYTIYIFCEEESVAYPGHSFSVFKGNRMARLYGLDKIFDEITMSYSLLFGQSEQGLEILRSQSDRQWTMIQEGQHGPGHQVAGIFSWTDLQSLAKFGRQAGDAGDFAVFGRRWERLYIQLARWKPQRLEQLLRPGSAGVDHFTWCTQIFPIIIAVIGLLGITISILQTSFAIKAYKDNMSISLRLLNASLESLALQKQKMNLIDS